MKILITGGSGFIGTNLIEYLIERKIDFLNVDIKAPSKKEHDKYWTEIDILDLDKLKQAFKSYQPTHVVHLAARTDTDSNILGEYVVNTQGTANVLVAIKEVAFVQRVIITSTQFVHRPGELPKDDFDFLPHTTYGESKVVTEKLTREAKLNCCWTIIRPTNVWGPWHSRYPNEFWNVLKKGLYFHPGHKRVIRSYAYVGNVVYQIMKIFEKPGDEVTEKVFYVGDKPIMLIDWVNGFSLAITGRKARIIPGEFVQILGYVGDILSVIKVKFPITSSRYRSMTQDYLTPMDFTFKVLGIPPYSMKEGIDITIQWLKNGFQKH